MRVKLARDPGAARRQRTRRAAGALGIGLGLALAAGCKIEQEVQPILAADHASHPAPGEITRKRLEQLAPGRGYLEAHASLDDPKRLLGGAVEVLVEQHEGRAFAVLPGPRELGEDVFGTPDLPRAAAGSPLITGVPLSMRTVEGGKYGRTTRDTSEGQEVVEVRRVALYLRARDATATDAARSEDRVAFEACWQDDRGDTYRVTCHRLEPLGVEWPMFGGVVTNHLLHGFTRIASPLVPTVFCYVGFWGRGDVEKNGELLDRGRIVHGMLIEASRTRGDHRPVSDREVDPRRVEFRLEVPDFEVHGDDYEERPVHTGFEHHGREVPFWHVVFEDAEVRAGRG